jgi:hypothetical protein
MTPFIVMPIHLQSWHHVQVLERNDAGLTSCVEIVASGEFSTVLRKPALIWATAPALVSSGYKNRDRARPCQL